MRRYLAAKRELPDVSVTALAPISVRTDEERGSMGNQIAAMFVPLGSHIGSVKERMEYVVGETTKSKAMTEALGARQIAEMAKLAQVYPGYGFERHMGYPTPAHRRALQSLGPTPQHRRSFAPVAAAFAARLETASVSNIEHMSFD